MLPHCIYNVLLKEKHFFNQTYKPNCVSDVQVWTVLQCNSGSFRTPTKQNV